MTRRYELPRGASDYRLPDPAAMVRLYVLTGGAVQPNDFYDLPALDAPVDATGAAGGAGGEPAQPVPVTAEDGGAANPADPPAAPTPPAPGPGPAPDPVHAGRRGSAGRPFAVTSSAGRKAAQARWAAWRANRAPPVQP